MRLCILLAVVLAAPSLGAQVHARYHYSTSTPLLTLMTVDGDVLHAEVLSLREEEVRLRVHVADGQVIATRQLEEFDKTSRFDIREASAPEKPAAYLDLARLAVKEDLPHRARRNLARARKLTGDPTLGADVGAALAKSRPTAVPAAAASGEKKATEADDGPPVHETEEHTRLLQIARKRLELAERYHAMVMQNSQYSDERAQLKEAIGDAAGTIDEVDRLLKRYPHDDTLTKLSKPIRRRAEEVLVSSLVDKSYLEYMHGQFRYAKVDAKRALGVDPQNARAQELVERVDLAVRSRHL
jgi:hypothetical protein